MKRFTIIGFSFAFTCFAFATPAVAQWGLGPQVMTMARDGVLGPELANRVHQLQYERFQTRYPDGTFGSPNQFPNYQIPNNQFPTNRFGQTTQGFPPGKAWGLRGGKPYTGNGHPLNGVPNGRAFQGPNTIQNGIAPGNRGRTFRTLPGYDRGGRGFGGRGRGFGRGRGRR